MRQGFEWSVNYPKFETGLPASPVRGREGLAMLATMVGIYQYNCGSIYLLLFIRACIAAEETHYQMVWL